MKRNDVFFSLWKFWLLEEMMEFCHGICLLRKWWNLYHGTCLLRGMMYIFRSGMWCAAEQWWHFPWWKFACTVMNEPLFPHGIFMPAQSWNSLHGILIAESWWNFLHWISVLMKTDGMLESAMECVNIEMERERGRWHFMWNLSTEEWWKGGICCRMCQHREEGNIPDGFFSAEEGGILECSWNGQHWEREETFRMEFVYWWTMEWWNLPQIVSAQRETEQAAGERQANVFLLDRIFLGFWQRMLDPELGLLRNWEGVLNWVAVSFFEASTKTSVGSSDSQRISCASKSAADIVVDGAHTNSRHWYCRPWCPPLGSRPLCKQPLHLFPSSLLPPLEKN